MSSDRRLKLPPPCLLLVAVALTHESMSTSPGQDPPIWAGFRQFLGLHQRSELVHGAVAKRRSETRCHVGWQLALRNFGLSRVLSCAQPRVQRGFVL